MANFTGLQMDAIRAKEEADRKAYEATTTGAMVNGYPVTIEVLRRVFEQVQDKHHWKRPVNAMVHHDRVNLVVEAVIFYHGIKPTVTKIDERYAIVEDHGYAG